MSISKQHIIDYFQQEGQDSADFTDAVNRRNLEAVQAGNLYLPPPGHLDCGSAAWAWIKDWLEYKINALRLENDGLSLSMERTTALRAQIQLCKQIIALDQTTTR